MVSDTSLSGSFTSLVELSQILSANLVKSEQWSPVDFVGEANGESGRMCSRLFLRTETERWTSKSRTLLSNHRLSLTENMRGKSSLETPTFLDFQPLQR